MAFKIKGSHIVALLITAGVSGWLYTGSIVIGGQSTGDGAVAISEREAERSSELFKVRFVTLQPEQRQGELIVHGRTKASAIVPIKAQVSGILEARSFSRGDHVNKGDLVCKVDVGARAAQLAQAEAQLAKAQADFDANSTLVNKGIVSKNTLKTMQAALNSASASIAQAKLNLERSNIKANASGVVQDPIAQIGDMMNVGSTCLTLVQADPIKFSGQVSERDIDKIRIGAEVEINLVTGRKVAGKVRYIAPSADSATRTFLTEIDIPNADGAIRDGITARAKINLQPIMAYRLSPSWITLSDEGDVGVRTIVDNNKVKFVPIRMIAQSNSGFWVLGLDPGVRVISLGQEYVVDGERVEAVVDTALANAIQAGRIMQ